MTNWMKIANAVFFNLKLFVFVFIPYSWVMGYYHIWYKLKLWGLDVDLVYNRDFNMEVLAGLLPNGKGFLVTICFTVVIYIFLKIVEYYSDKYSIWSKRSLALKKFNSYMNKHLYSYKTTTPQKPKSSLGFVIPIIATSIYVFILLSLIFNEYDLRKEIKAEFQSVNDKKATFLTEISPKKGRTPRQIYIVQCGTLCGVYFANTDTVGYLKPQDIADFVIQNKTKPSQKDKKSKHG